MAEGDADLDALLARHPHLLDTRLPLRHWSRELLFSGAAKERWVEPDLAPLVR